MIKKAAAIAGILILSGLAAAYYMYQKPVASLADQTPTAVLSSIKLFAAFADDESAANAEFTGNVVEVQGPVVEIMTNSDASTTIILQSDDLIFGVKCRLDPKTEHSRISTGKNIRLKGLCVGMNTDVELDRCVILPLN